MLEIYFERQLEYDKDVHYLHYYLIYSWKKLMQTALTPVNSSENDCFADDVVEDSEETDTPLSSVSVEERPLCNLQFADDINLLGSSEEELQQLTQRLQ